MLGVVCTAFMSKVLLGVGVDLVEVFIVEVEFLYCPDDGFPVVDLNDTMVPLLCAWGVLEGS